MQGTAELSADTAPQPQRSRLYANAAYLWASTLTTSLAGLGFWTLVARLRSSEELGLGAAAASAMMLLVMLCHLGLGSGLVRFAPLEGRSLPLLMNSSFTLSALAATAAAGVFLLGLPLWAPGLRFLRDGPLLAPAFVVFTAAATVFWVQDQALLARRQGRPLFLRSLLHNLLRLLAPAALLGVMAGPGGIVVSVGLPVVISAALGGALILPAAVPGYRPRPQLARRRLARVMPFSAGAYASELALTAPGLVLPLMVVQLRGAEEAGYFYAAWFLGSLLSTASFSLALSLFAEGSQREARLPSLLRSTRTSALALAGLGALAAFFLADELLLAFGRPYSQDASSLLRLVALAGLPAAVTNVYLAEQRVRRRLGALVAVPALAAAATLAGSLLLLPGLGLSGAGAGILMGQGLGAALALADGLRTARRGEGAPEAAGRAGPAGAAAARPPVSVVICALNEAPNLRHVLPRIPAWVHEVILVDGRSTDNTVEVARALRPGIRVLYQLGRGKGDALRCGVEGAAGEIVVTMDADGETDPDDLPGFVDRLREGHDFIKGSRFAGGWRGKPLHRLIGNYVIARTCNALFGTRFTDLCSGYNAFWRDVPERVELWDRDGWNYEPLLIARALRAGLDVVEEPQRYRGRAGEASKLGSWTQGLTAMKVLLRERFGEGGGGRSAGRRTG